VTPIENLATSAIGQTVKKQTFVILGNIGTMPVIYRRPQPLACLLFAVSGPRSDEF